jgi:hypothetical protein
MCQRGFNHIINLTHLILIDVFYNSVTVVDSGTKALKFLGLVEDEVRNEKPPSIATETDQVQLCCYSTNTYV